MYYIYVWILLFGAICMNLAGIIISVLHTDSTLNNFLDDDLIFNSNVTFHDDVCFNGEVIINNLNVTNNTIVEDELIITSSTINEFEVNCTTINDSLNVTQNFIIDEWNTSLVINVTNLNVDNITTETLSVSSVSNISGSSNFNNTSLEGNLEFEDLSENEVVILTLENGTLNTEGTLDVGSWSPNITIISGITGTPTSGVQIFRRVGNIVYGYFTISGLSATEGDVPIIQFDVPIEKINADSLVFGDARIFEDSPSNLNGAWITNTSPPSTTQLILTYTVQTSGSASIIPFFTYSIV